MRSFAFHDSWVLAAPPERVHAVLTDLEHYPDWWPQVVAVAKIDDDTARVLCRSTLPYTLDLVLGAVHRRPDLLQTTIDGDLVGTVSWRLSEVAGSTRLDFRQDVVVGRPLLHWVAGPLRPVLAWNHQRMMAGCVGGLRARLAQDSSV